ncbi:hypothetical protein M9Y10_022127 [Tritrichomonas musculus]|uniref:RING-type domain-containing protein n=1 Tax=Tritrichomonas musculus TaxID=1915356 RepID=A0ABR2KRD7_9EUKA
MSDFHVQKQVYEQIDTKYPPVLACSSGSVFMYSTANGLLRLFYTQPEINVNLPKSPFVDSRASCIAISPPHTFGVICYEDGSILIYNLIEKKVLKSLSKELKGKITNIAFLSDFDFVTFDSTLTLTLFTLVSMSIFGYTVKSTKIQTFKFFAFQIASPPIYRAVYELPKNIDTVSYRYSDKFDHFVAISLHKKLIIAKIRPSFKIIYETVDDDEDIENPHVSFSLPNPDNLYAVYSTKKEIFAIGITQDSNRNYLCRVLFQRPYIHAIRFLSFFSTSLIAVVNDNNFLYLFDFLNPKNSDHSERISQCNILLDDLGKIDTFTNRILISYYINTFATTVESLKAEKKFKEIIELAKKAAQNDPNSSVGLSTDPQVRSSEIESITNPIFADYFKSQTNFIMKDYAEEVVSLMDDLHNKGFIAQDALSMFVQWGGTKDFFSSVLSHDPEGQKFTYNPNFVQILIDKYDHDEYFQKDDEKQQYFDQIKKFLLSLPPKIAKPKWLINFAIKRKDFSMVTKVFVDRMNEPVMGLSLAESNDHSELIPDILNNNHFKGNAKMIEWLLQADPKENKYPRLQNAIIVSSDKMLDALRWMNETMVKLLEEAAKKSLEEAEKNQSKDQNAPSTVDNTKSINLMRDLYIYLKQSSGMPLNESDSSSQSDDHQLNNSSSLLDSVQNTDTSNANQIIITNDYYVNAIITTFINLKIDYQSDLFKLMEDYIIKNCPNQFTPNSLKYVIGSVFNKEFKEPDLRETLLSSLIFNEHVIPNDMALSLLPICESFEYDEAAAFIRNKLHLTGELLKSVIIDNGLDDALSFINANYRDDLQSMEEIENVVIYYAPYFIEHNCAKFIDVLTNVRFRILYTDLPRSISVANTRLYFLKNLYIKFEPPKSDTSTSTKETKFATTLLKNWTLKLRKAQKAKEKANADPLAEIFQAYQKDDMDTVYALADEYFGNKSKFILPIILKNMTPEKLQQLENMNENQHEQKSEIQKLSEFVNGTLMLKIQQMIEDELKSREEKAKNAAEKEAERAKKDEEKRKENQKMEEFFAAGKIELEKNVKSIIPFLTHYFPEDVITVMKKFPGGVIEQDNGKANHDSDNKSNNQSILETCESAGLYNCCAYYEALNRNIGESLKYLRTTIIIDPIKYERSIIDTCQLIFDINKNNSKTNNEKKEVGGWYDDDQKSDSNEKNKDDDDEEEEEEEEDNDNDDNENNKGAANNGRKKVLVDYASFILKSFAVKFNKENNIDNLARVYRHVCDVIELSNIESFEEILLFTKKVFGAMQKKTDNKFQRIIRALAVSRIYSGKTSLKAREFIKSIVNENVKQRDNTDKDIDNTNEELGEYLNAISCANCKVRLLVGTEPIAVLECGHAVHYKPYCCSAAAAGEPAPTDQIQKNMCNMHVECPICSKKQEEGQKENQNQQEQQS